MRRCFLFIASFFVSLIAAAATPDEAFMSSKLLVRPGISDLGDITVREYTDRIKRMSLDDGTSPQVRGWEKRNNIYTLNLKFKDDPARFTFVHNLSSGSKGGVSLLQSVNINGEEMNALMFTLIMRDTPTTKSANAATSKPPPPPQSHNEPEFQTTIEMKQEMQGEYEIADKKLTDAYKKAIAIAKEQDDGKEGQFVTALRESERAWIKFRDLNCDMHAMHLLGGTMYGLERGGCMLNMVEARTKELQDWVTVYE